MLQAAGGSLCKGYFLWEGWGEGETQHRGVEEVGEAVGREEEDSDQVVALRGTFPGLGGLVWPLLSPLLSPHFRPPALGNPAVPSLGRPATTAAAGPR